ncbi:MAG: methyl-accepting chemotaxis protein, partial [Synergistaceae bacterium]|nr:methyl-accepting chemotaxis protein [Synergistaceae bacterium]
MAWLRNRSIGGKLGILAAIPLILLIAITVFNKAAIRRVDDRYSFAFENYATHATSMAVFRSNLQASQKNVLKVILTDDPVEIKAAKDEIDMRRRENAGILDDFKKSQLDDKVKPLLSRVETMLPGLRAGQDKVIEMAGAAGADGDIWAARDAAEKNYFDEVEPFTDEFTDVVRKLSQLLIDLTNEVNESSTVYADSISATGITIAAVATIFSLLMGFTIARYITKPINSMKEKIAVFAGGDLTVSFANDGKDAVAQMGNALDRMAGSLRGVVNTIKGAGGSISDSAQDFSAMAEQTNASVEEFRANVDEMNANLNGLASSSEEVNASVEEVAAGAQTTAEKGTDIARKVDNA